MASAGYDEAWKLRLGTDSRWLLRLKRHYKPRRLFLRSVHLVTQQRSLLRLAPKQGRQSCRVSSDGGAVRLDASAAMSQGTRRLNVTYFSRVGSPITSRPAGP